MSIYIAGKFSARQRLRSVRQSLRDLGFVCHSSWLDQPDAADYPPPDEYGITDGHPSAEAFVDVGEIEGADFLILDTLDQSVTGGREFEIGYAHGLGKPFWRVGPRRHLFHDLAECYFPSWEVLLGHLAQ